MSHEIRTPMNGIMGMVQIAQKHYDDAALTKENLGKIALSSERLLRLINEVLDISKVESGRAELNVQPFWLHELVEEAASAVAPQFDAKEIAFSCQLPEEMELLSGDAGRLRRILVNLLGNAAKYTPKGGHVSLTVASGPGDLPGSVLLAFVVADDGIGMTPEFMERVFEPFAMEGRGASEGSGLGMSIVRSCVQTMGGEVRVSSQVNCGSTFTVTLNFGLLKASGAVDCEPAAKAGDEVDTGFASAIAARASAEECAEGSAEEHAGASSKANVEAIDLSGMRVLLAEDNELNAEIVRELLRCEGVVVERAADGKQVCEMFAASEPGAFDAILMDVRMPVMDGLEAARCIRALDRADAKEVPIVALSANAFAEDVRASLKSGMNDHLSKPIDLNKTKEVLTRLVRERKDAR